MNVNKTTIDTLFTMNKTVCEHLDEAVEVVLMLHDVAMLPRQVDDVMPLIFVPIGLLILSIVFLFFGRRFVRLTAGFAALCVVFFFLYTSHTLQDWECATRTLVSIAAGFICGVLAAFLIKVGLFVIGSAAIGAIVHVTFASFPELHALGDQPQFWNMSVGYWICMAIAIVCGGVIVRWHTKIIMEVLTATIGGLGVTYSLYSISIITNLQITRWVFVGVGGVGICLGICVQRMNRLKKEPGRRRHKRDRSGQSINTDQTVSIHA